MQAPATPLENDHYIPGMRVEIRDAEWRLKRVDRSADGGYLLECVGQSELVRGRSAQFLTRIEQNIRVLDPARTRLVDDLSDGYLAGQLYIDTALRRTPPVDDRIHLGHRAAMDVLPFQLDPARQALQQPRQRILIADSVGLGKTLEAGILLTELIRRGRGKRILVLAVKSMLTQFQQEMWQRFTIPLVRLDSIGLQRVRNQIPTNHNPFHYFDRAIISIDTLKQTLEYRHYLEQAYWDIIVIDEAHNVAKRNNASQRYQLANLLSTRSDTLIMLSATPHDGKPESFASLMNMLDPTAIANPRDYAHEDFRDKGLVVRRFKQDIADQLSTRFPEREIDTETVDATGVEEEAFQRIAEARFATLDGTRLSAGQLFRTTLEKALFSSPAACLATIEHRLAKLQKAEATPERQQDIDTLEGIRLAVAAIDPAHFSKYQQLLELLGRRQPGALGWPHNDPEDRLVIFTESLETLGFLRERLQQDLKLKKGQLATLTGTMRDSELTRIVEDFGQKSSPIRLLLCSDVAAEGINLHHLSHRMIHFDIPWSLMIFQQRNGRIDRYGQTRRPQIRYLMTQSRHPRVRGDQRILEVLIEKDEQAGRNIGDPSEFMGVFSPQEEEAKVAAVIEKEKDPNDLSDIYDSLFGDTAEQAETGLKNFLPEKSVSTRADLGKITADDSLVFSDDLAYAKAALDWLKASGAQINYRVDNARRQLDLSATADLALRLNFLPREVRPEGNRFLLSDDRQQIQQTIQSRRSNDDTTYTDLQFLWPQHPVMEWLADRISDAFGRHTAPVIRIPQHMEPDSHYFIVQGGFPNKRGQALIQQTLAILVENGQIVFHDDLTTVLHAVGIHGDRIPNNATAGDCDKLQQLLPLVIDDAAKQLRQLRDKIEADRRNSLRARLDDLKKLREKHLGQLQNELQQSKLADQFKRRKEQERRDHIDAVFNEYQNWLQETQQTEEDPYIQIIAVLTGDPA